MYAIVDTGGRQARVKQGDTIKVELRASTKAGDKLELPVLLVGEGADVKVGAPIVAGAKVEAEVVGHGKHRKVWHYRTQEEGWDRIRGHRQQYTELKIVSVAGEQAPAKVEAKA
jgi:large subunit ribosomal protein L21